MGFEVDEERVEGDEVDFVVAVVLRLRPGATTDGNGAGSTMGRADIATTGIVAAEELLAGTNVCSKLEIGRGSAVGID